MASQKHCINRAISSLYSVLLPTTFLLLTFQLHITQTFSQRDFSYADYSVGNDSLEDRIDENFTDTNVTDTNSHWFIGSGSQYRIFEAIVITIILICIIVGTIIGNILVCVAVCLVKKLRRPYNYLIVSLAVSDLCVAVLVMPMAMLYEVLGRWPFGPVICDLWVSFDVLSCTASILNLCMISVDRYYAITKPLEYGVKRTPKRMILCVFLVWFGAACISLPPLLILGNEREEYHCIVCQNFGYQIYATVGSFYLPLTVMIVVYYKIFRAARKIVMEEKRAQSHLEAPHYLEINVKNGRAAESKLLTGVNNATTDIPDDTPYRAHQKYNKGAVRRSTSSMSRCFSSGQRKSNESQCPMLNQPNTPSKPGEDLRSESTRESDNNANISGTRKNEEAVSTANRIRNSFSNFAHKNHVNFSKEAISSPHQKKLRFQLAKERKASTTLGIIMSAFIICWLPFFVLALVRPFLHDQNDIPATFSSLFLWLGYANSLLNPIIYATLNKDFRKPFQEILFFRCSNLNNIMREDFYHSQYGDPETHHCALNNSSKAQNFEVETEVVAVVDKDNSGSASATYL